MGKTPSLGYGDHGHKHQWCVHCRQNDDRCFGSCDQNGILEFGGPCPQADRQRAFPGPSVVVKVAQVVHVQREVILTPWT
jgi:hypothetical protein